MTDPTRLENYRNVAGIVCDNLGCGLDDGIKDVCVGLWLHGIWTFGPSCWGHEDRLGVHYMPHPFTSLPNDGLTMEMISPLIDGFDLTVRRDVFTDGSRVTRLFHAEYSKNKDEYERLQGEFLPSRYKPDGEGGHVWVDSEREDKGEVIAKMRKWQAEFARFANHLIATAE